MTRFHCLSACASLALAGILVVSTASAENLPATITLGDLTQTYDGSPKLPTVTTDPPGLAVSWEFTDPTGTDPEPVAEETVYCNMPATLGLSYASLSFAAQSTFGLGDQVELASTARELTSVDVVLVSWAKAATYPLYSLQNPEGWNHPVTITVFDMNGAGVLNRVGEFTREIFVPWRPLLLPNGKPYRFNGIALNAHFDFPPGLVLPARPVFLVSYNTQNSGFLPIEIPGPYNELNVAVGGGPTVGTDVNPAAALWVRSATNWVYPATGTSPPMFTVKACGISDPADSGPQTNAGTWQITAKISEPGYEGETTGNFTILPASAEVLLESLIQVVDGSPRSAIISTIPANLPVAVTYDNSEILPKLVGKYAVHATVLDPNYSGGAVGELRLGHNLGSWMESWIETGALDPSASGSQDDPDNDSIGNLLEYAFALDPTSAAPNVTDRGLPRVGYIDQHLSLTYRKNLAATDLEYIVQTSDRLGINGLWESATTEDMVVEEDGATQTIRATLPAATAEAKRFLRLSVIRH